MCKFDSGQIIPRHSSWTSMQQNTPGVSTQHSALINWIYTGHQYMSCGIAEKTGITGGCGEKQVFISIAVYICISYVGKNTNL